MTLAEIEDRLNNAVPFTFVRFSDGELEILNGRPLVISRGDTLFRGAWLHNSYPEIDEKEFHPDRPEHAQLSSDLLASAKFRNNGYVKGVPAAHNLYSDPQALTNQELMIKLNGGTVSGLTFSDLFLNSNFLAFRRRILPQILRSRKLTLLVNERATPLEQLAHAAKIRIETNFFASYPKTLNRVMNQMLQVPFGSMVLSSASSLSNIVGHKLYQERPDLTFLDIGTSINDLLGLPFPTRQYHHLLLKNPRSRLKSLKMKMTPNHYLRW